MKKIFILIIIFLILISVLSLIYKMWPTSNFYVEKQIPDLPDMSEVQEYIYDEWVWNYSDVGDGKQLKPKDKSLFILTLTKEGKLTSTTDCNTVSGSFVKNENVLSMGSFVMTEKACTGETLESSYVTQLSLVSGYEISGNTLTLQLVKDSGTMVFSRK